MMRIFGCQSGIIVPNANFLWQRQYLVILDPLCPRLRGFVHVSCNLIDDYWSEYALQVFERSGVMVG